MKWIKIKEKNGWKTLISLLTFTLLFNIIQSLRGYPIFIDDLIKRFYLDWFAFVIAFYLFKKIIPWLNTYFDWNENPKKRFFVESTIKVFSIAGTIILLHIIFSFIFIVITINGTSNPYSDNVWGLIVQRLFGNYTFISYFDIFIKFTVLVLVIELTVIFDFSTYLIQKWNNSKIEKEAFEKEKAQFSLELLRTQINPHFLFNNLNTLSSLIYVNQDKAADFLRKLSSVYRTILEYRDKESITLVEELVFYKTYADLLQVRFKNMLFFEVEVDENLNEKKIIPLTIQMLVENAIKHNVISASKPLTITLKTIGNTIEISNNLQLKETKEYSSGLGLVMISNRYEYLSDKKIKIEKSESFFKVTVPLID